VPFFLRFFTSLPALVTAAAVLLCPVAPVSAAGAPDAVRIAGPGHQPQLIFACCDKSIVDTQTLLADSEVVANLTALHAALALALPDFSPARAQIVRQLNADGIPVVAWIQLPPGQGTYINAGNVPQTLAAFTAFEQWSERCQLHWQAVGLDIEPNFAQLARLRSHPFHLACLLAQRYVNRGRVLRARSAYSGLIRRLQSRGFFVQTYQLPFIVEERQEHSTFLERMLGIVDVRGNQEALMIYTSFAPPQVGPGIVRELGPSAEAIVVGTTEAAPGARSLDWNAFSRDLIVAAHFTPTVGVYNLEGCIHQGFLSRLRSMDWGQTVEIPAGSLAAARARAGIARRVVWLGTWLPALLVLFILVVAGLVWFWRRRSRWVR
jgi:hypothetical protein